MIFPPSLAPPAPFPLVTSSAVTSAFVAPGIRRATYRLSTSAGPLVVDLVAIDLREPTVRLDAVVAHDRLISQGETVSSMAARTGAVAGVNADYFDIGQTNQPLNVVVSGGNLLRSPSTRAAMTVGRDRSVRFGSVRFTGDVRYGGSDVPLTGIGIWPPQGGASLMLPSYGAIRPAPGVRLAALEALDDRAGTRTYRVTRIDDGAPSAPAAAYLAFGPAALALAPAPAPGDTVAVGATLDPPLATLACAVGGGPLLVAGGAAVEDPNAPAPEERDRRFPVSGAATLADGSLLFVAVDGRVPATSIGLTRPEFGALMLGLGARDALAFDSGGSATLVARVLGDERASVLNAPSDGVERPVADGIFAFSDAPRGVHPHPIARPDRFAALPGVRVALRGAIVDDAGHRLGPATLEPLVTARERGAHVANAAVAGGASGGTARVEYDVVDGLASLAIEPQDVDLTPGATLRFRASGTAANGSQVELGDGVRWHADGGTIALDGTFVAGVRNATLTAEAGGARAKIVVYVGSHDVALPLFSPPQAARWRFASVPKGSAGAVELADGDELVLRYDFTGGGRAAYARAEIALPGAPVALAFDVRGDGGGAALRVLVSNRFGEQRALTVSKRVDWTGWRRVEVTLPPDVNPPVMLLSIYAVPSVGGAPARTAGQLAFRNAVAALAGTP